MWAAIPAAIVWLAVKDLQPEDGYFEEIPKNFHLREWMKELQSQGSQTKLQQHLQHENIDALREEVLMLRHQLALEAAAEQQSDGAGSLRDKEGSDNEDRRITQLTQQLAAILERLHHLEASVNSIAQPGKPTQAGDTQATSTGSAKE